MREQEVRNLWEAYLEVCEQETGRGPRVSDTYDMRDAEGGPKGGGTIKGPKKKNVITKEETDLYDTILEHLIAEGYADTEESALAIMANMSEEWREDILVEAGKNDARIRGNIKSFGSNYTPPRDWDQSANRGQGAVLNAKQKEKQRRKGLRQEEVETWVNDLIEDGYDLSSYTWEEMYEMYVTEGEKPFPYKKVKAKQVALRDKGSAGLDSRMKMGMAVRRAKEADKKGGSQQDAGKDWYHGK